MDHILGGCAQSSGCSRSRRPGLCTFGLLFSVDLSIAGGQISWGDGSPSAVEGSLAAYFPGKCLS